MDALEETCIKKIIRTFHNLWIKEKEGGEGKKMGNESLLLNFFEVRVYGYVYCQRRNHKTGETWLVSICEGSDQTL